MNRTRNSANSYPDKTQHRSIVARFRQHKEPEAGKRETDDSGTHLAQRARLQLANAPSVGRQQRIARMRGEEWGGGGGGGDNNDARHE